MQKILSSVSWNEAMAVLSGLMLTAAFPKAGVPLLAWVALVPLMVSLRGQSCRAGFRIGFIAGIAHFLSLMYWLAYTMRTFGYLPWYLSVPVLFLLTAYLAIYLGVFCGVLARLCPTPIRLLALAPPLWVGLEYLRSVLFTGLPWGLAGYSQYRVLPVIQIADLSGVYGVSFLILLCNVALALLFFAFAGKPWQGGPVSRRIGLGSILIVGLGLVLVWSYGARRVNGVDRESAGNPAVRISVIQGNIDQAVKWDPKFQDATLEKYLGLSLSARKDGPELIIWPETATPFYFLRDAQRSARLLEGIRQTGIDFLIGSPHFIQRENRTDYFNSAYLVRADGSVLGKYDKVHLVPFGEYVPLKRFLPFLGKMVAEVGDFRPGARGRTLAWRNSNVGMLICYEIIFPELARHLVKNRAAVLVNLTNDAWFGKTAAPYQHFSMAVFRAVENRRSLVRAANTGISGFIDPAGRIVARTDLFCDAVLTRPVALCRETAFYTRYGDLFVLACWATVLAGVLPMVLARIPR